MAENQAILIIIVAGLALFLAVVALGKAMVNSHTLNKANLFKWRGHYMGNYKDYTDVQELEDKVDKLYQHLGIRYVPIQECDSRIRTLKKETDEQDQTE